MPVASVVHEDCIFSFALDRFGLIQTLGALRHSEANGIFFGRLYGFAIPGSGVYRG